MNTLILILVLVVGIILGSVWGIYKRKNSLSNINKQNDLISKQTKRKEGHKEKILEFLKINFKIVNNDVEKLVDVSDATAERYLDELEKEGKIKQIGKTGNAVYYQLT